MKRLVIVESPAKAKTIAGYLGSDFVVQSSIGHIRDLPNRAGDIPKEQRARYGTLGVAINDGFEPLYLVDPDKKRVVADLRKQLAEAGELLLATDEDREGEAIAWHLLQVLKPKVPVRRMVFHEITKDAIQRALEETRDINEKLVDAQETRRILDRLYGYEVSPVLWKKVTQGLSAGRVQSVATRLVVERERERMAFVVAGYWDILGTFEPGTFNARLTSLAGKRVAQGRDFGSDGLLRDPAGTIVVDEERARRVATDLDGQTFTVSSVEERPYTRRPSAPFMTSTLQQEASRKLRYSSQTTMRVAQRLYENGYITYMRTDSTTLSELALNAARKQAVALYGNEYVPAAPRRYERKVKNAQEAHEAIRPAGDSFRTPTEVASELNRDELALYDLVWKRTIASQMEDARGQTVSLRLEAVSRDEERVEFGTAGTVITFRGFLAAYEEGKDDPAEEDEERRLPALAKGDQLTATELAPDGHSTAAPSRFTEASLVKALEERGIGRPSTYASIMGTILDRGYVFKKGTALVPTFRAFAVTRLLEQHFGQLVDYDFTARMEDDLDRIASGDEGRTDWLKRFYFGNDNDPGLHHLVTDHLDEIDARAVNSIPIPRSDISIRVGRYGPYLERGETRATIPDNIPPDELTAERAEQFLAAPSGDRELGIDPETMTTIVVKAGRYGPYVTEVLPEGEAKKPRTGSLLSSMTVETVTLNDALRLLALPRLVGAVDGEDVYAQTGRYGPFIKRGEDTRSLENEDQIFTLTVEQAAALFAEPKAQRRGAAKPPLRDFGVVENGNGKPLVVKEGRFGPYVTDGETNASLRPGDDPETLTLERALELLADRRARGDTAPRKRATRKRS